MRTKPFFPDPQYFPSKPSSYFNYINMRILATCIAEQKCFCTNLPRKSSWNIASQSCTDYGNIQYSKRNYKPYFRHHVIYIWGLWQKWSLILYGISTTFSWNQLVPMPCSTISSSCRVRVEPAQHTSTMFDTFLILNWVFVFAIE